MFSLDVELKFKMSICAELLTLSSSAPNSQPNLNSLNLNSLTLNYQLSRRNSPLRFPISRNITRGIDFNARILCIPCRVSLLGELSSFHLSRSQRSHSQHNLNAPTLDSITLNSQFVASQWQRNLNRNSCCAQAA